MKKEQKIMICLALFLFIVQMGFSRGDKIIPQIVDGPGVITKLDIINISSRQAISSMRIAFKQNNGSPWILQTNLGTGSQFPLTLQPRQTLRIETSGGAQMGAGYAVIYDEESGNSQFSEDYVLGISDFYVLSNGSEVVETVSLSVPQPTQAATAPVQIDDLNGIYSGFAFINTLTGSANPIRITLYSEDGTTGPNLTTSFDLSGGWQRAEFLNENLFPGLTAFKGMAEITSSGPIVLLGLLQARAANGVQYSTLAAVDKTDLRRNSYMILKQASDDSRPIMPLDVDAFASDYFRISGGPESRSWELAYQYESTNRNSRFLQPYNGTAIASLGIHDSDSFNSITLPYLKGLNNYSYNKLFLDGGNLLVGFTFAVRTNRGNYAKVRIEGIIDTTDGQYQNTDLVLKVCVYR